MREADVMRDVSGAAEGRTFSVHCQQTWLKIRHLSAYFRLISRVLAWSSKLYKLHELTLAIKGDARHLFIDRHNFVFCTSFLFHCIVLFFVFTVLLRCDSGILHVTLNWIELQEGRSECWSLRRNLSPDSVSWAGYMVVPQPIPASLLLCRPHM